ncbi:hypothetical protein QE152_g35064 [Popillia japonica]|uniref:Uncharacterized protein n=1 Tax=Popillia japonica TaxID=7064 RepID=A0AAW1IST4_POPJA
MCALALLKRILFLKVYLDSHYSSIFVSLVARGHNPEQMFSIFTHYRLYVHTRVTLSRENIRLKYSSQSELEKTTSEFYNDISDGAISETEDNVFENVIIQETNRKAVALKVNEWQDASGIEMKAFLGLLIIAESLKASQEPILEL